MHVDGVRIQGLLPISHWPRSRIFPEDPAADAGLEDLAYYFVENNGESRRGDGRNPSGGLDSDGVDGWEDEALWRVWLRLPAMKTGERAVRVLSYHPYILCMLRLPLPNPQFSACACQHAEDARNICVRFCCVFTINMPCRMYHNCGTRSSRIF